MSQVIILKIGYDHYALPFKSGVAGKLMELLNEATPVRENYRSALEGGYRYNVIPCRATVEIKMVPKTHILPPAPEDERIPEAIDIKALPGAMKLLKGGRS